jgi:hypothetical protein
MCVCELAVSSIANTSSNKQPDVQYFIIRLHQFDAIPVLVHWCGLQSLIAHVLT